MEDKAVITGNEPFYPTLQSYQTGVTIYQEAVLRFMTECIKAWSSPEDAARFSHECAKEYIKSLNS